MFSNTLLTIAGYIIDNTCCMPLALLLAGGVLFVYMEGDAHKNTEELTSCSQFFGASLAYSTFSVEYVLTEGGE